MAGLAHRGSGGASSSRGRCYAVAPKVSSGVWGIGVRTRCASGSGWALRCGVIGRGVRGTAQVVNDFGSAVLAANVELICLGSPAFCALRVFFLLVTVLCVADRDASLDKRRSSSPTNSENSGPRRSWSVGRRPLARSWPNPLVLLPPRRCLCRHVRSSRRSERPPCPRPDTA
jgi:hypothetical protein